MKKTGNWENKPVHSDFSECLRIINELEVFKPYPGFVQFDSDGDPTTCLDIETERDFVSWRPNHKTKELPNWVKPMKFSEFLDNHLTVVQVLSDAKELGFLNEIYEKIIEMNQYNIKVCQADDSAGRLYKTYGKVG